MTDEGDDIDLRSVLPQRTTSRPDGWEYALAKGGKTWWGYYDTSGLRPSSSRASTLAEQLSLCFGCVSPAVGDGVGAGVGEGVGAAM